MLEKIGADTNSVGKNKSALSIQSQKSKASNACKDSDESEESECDSSEEEDVKPIIGKQVKKFNDQRFTIETTVTVEACDKDRKKNKKLDKSSCMPFVPPEPTPPKKKSKRN